MAVRLIFGYEGDDIRLMSRQLIDVVSPPAEPLERGVEGRSGFWVEVRDAAGQPLRRQVMRDPIPRDVEVFSEDPNQSVARIPVERPTGVFVVVVPEIEEADHVALIAAPLEQGSAIAQSREIARFGLAE